MNQFHQLRKASAACKEANGTDSFVSSLLYEEVDGMVRVDGAAESPMLTAADTNEEASAV